MKRALLLIVCCAAALAQYPVVHLNSSGHPATAHQAYHTWPILSGYTWFQQEGSTLTPSTLAPPILTFTNSGNGHEKMLLTPLAAPPYTITYGFAIVESDYTKQVSSTLILYDTVSDTGLIAANENEFAVTGNGRQCCQVIGGGHVSKFTGVDVDSFLTPLWVVDRQNLPAQRNWSKIKDDGINRTVYFSNDDAHTWLQVFQEPTGTYVNPNRTGIGFFSLESAAFTATFTVFSFTVTYP
jgi:hypothetical protein